jgi:hypothetical protein
MGRIVVQGQPRQTVHETPISKIIRAKWTVGVAQMVERLLCICKPQSHQKEKKNGGRGRGAVTQVVEHQPSKCEAPISNPSTAKKEKRMKGDRVWER